MSKRQEFKTIKMALTKTKSGFYTGGDRKAGKLPITLRVFGCNRCSWIGSNLCPNKILSGDHHANWICSERINYMKNELAKIGSVPRLIQNEMAIQLKMMNDKMIWEYAETGELSEDFKHINKNLISLIDKMRRQDEGIKFSEDITVTHQDFRKMVDIEAEKIEERDNKARQAEFTKEV